MFGEYTIEILKVEDDSYFETVTMPGVDPEDAEQKVYDELQDDLKDEVYFQVIDWHPCAEY